MEFNINVNINAPEMAAALAEIAKALGRSRLTAARDGLSGIPLDLPQTILGRKPEEIAKPAPLPVGPVTAPAPEPVPAIPAPAPAVPVSAPIPAAAPAPVPGPKPGPVAPAQPLPTSIQYEKPVVMTAAEAVSRTKAPAAETQPMKYTLNDLSVAGAKLIDRDRANMPLLQAALKKYGVRAATQLKPEQYPMFAADLRALGADI